MAGFRSSNRPTPYRFAPRNKRTQQWIGTSRSVQQLHLERLEERCVPSNYQFTTLPDPPGSVFGSAGINDHGEIVGGYTDAASITHGFLWSGGQYTTLDVPGSSFTTAYGINDNDQIVGGFANAAGTQGFLESGGSYTPLSPPGSYATGINNASEFVANFFSSPMGPVGFVQLSNNSIIEDWGGPNARGTQVWGINDNDEIVGDFIDPSGKQHGSSQLNFINTTIDVLVPGVVSTSVNGINDAGQVVGGYTDAAGHGHGFLYPGSGTNFTTIDVPDSRFTRCAGINEAGQIVGVYQDAAGILHTFLATPGVELMVTSQWNELDGSNGVFGTFLTGVPLPNTFTVTVNDPQNQVSDLSFSIDGAAGIQEQYAPGSNVWTYTTDMGQLDAGSHQLSIQAQTAAGNDVGDPFKGTVMAQDSVNLDLQATYPGGPASPQEINQFRFLDGTPITLTYSATITNLPLIDAYKDKLDLAFFSEPDEGSVIYANIPPLQAVSQDTASATFSLSTQDFHDVVPDTGFDYGVRVVPQASLGPAKQLSDAQDFRVIQLPAWMGNPTVTYDANAGEYDIPINLGPDWTFPLPGTIGMSTAFDVFAGLFGNLDSSLSAGVSLAVTAKPTIGPNDVNLEPTDWHASATLLGYPVLDPQQGSFLDGNIHVLATLDPITLAAPTSIRIINDPVIFQGITLFERNYSAQLPGILSLGGVLNLQADLTGSFQAQLTYLTAQASVQLDIGQDGSLSLDGQNSWLLITGSASATATLGVNLGVGANLLDVIGINQVGYTGLTCSGSLTAQLTTTLMVNFSGPLTAPMITLNQQASSAQMTIGYDVNINFYLLGGNLFSSEFTPDAPLVITLFGLDGGAPPPPRGGGAAPPGKPRRFEPGQSPLLVAVNLGYAEPVTSWRMPAEIHPVHRSMQPSRAGVVDRFFTSLNEPAEWPRLLPRTQVGSRNELLDEIVDAVL